MNWSVRSNTTILQIVETTTRYFMFIANTSSRAVCLFCFVLQHVLQDRIIVEKRLWLWTAAYYLWLMWCCRVGNKPAPQKWLLKIEIRNRQYKTWQGKKTIKLKPNVSTLVSPTDCKFSRLVLNIVYYLLFVFSSI